MELRPGWRTGRYHPVEGVARVRFGTCGRKRDLEIPGKPFHIGQVLPGWPDLRSHENKHESEIAGQSATCLAQCPSARWPFRRNQVGQYKAPAAKLRENQVLHHSSA